MLLARVILPAAMENQMDKKVEHEMESRFIYIYI